MNSPLQKLNSVDLASLAQEFLLAWQRAHGTSTGSAHGMVGPEGVVVFIENAFSRAEINMAHQKEGSSNDLLQRYVRSLLEHVCVEQRAAVETAVSRPVISTGVSMDPEAGWVMCVFRLGTNSS